MVVPFVLMLGGLLFALVKWGKAKVFPIVVAVLFGLALASTSFGPGILHGVRSASTSIVGTVAAAIK